MTDILVPFSYRISYRKREYFYFNRRIPADLRHHYNSAKVTYSLKTKSAKVATNRALIAAAQLDDYWLKLRMQTAVVPVQHLAVTDPARNTVVKSITVELGPTLTEAVKLYIRLKGNNRPKTFASSAERACRYLKEVRGDKHLVDYTKSDATAFRDVLIDRGMNGNSVTRVFGTVKSIVSFAANESGLTMINPFMGVYFDHKQGVTVRQPIPNDDIRVVQKVCVEKDDDIRWLVAMVADTGMRLAEAAGIHLSDIHLDEDVPFIRIQPHPWRRLKTKGSERDVPLVGSSLWAARRIVQNTEEGGIAFSRYNKTATTNAGSASGAINKWLKQYVPEGCTMHGFRHSMRDRLRDVECPTEIADQIGGWSSSASVGQTYGTGYSLSILHRWIKDAVG